MWIYWCISVHLVFAVLEWKTDGAPEVCQPRHQNIPATRECQKPCIRDSDCRSTRKKCRCDGICGLSCIKTGTECSTLADIPHGRVAMIPNNKFGAVAQYMCNEGYKLKGDPARVCQGDEQWSGTIPQCFLDYTEKPKCGPAPVVLNAHHNGDADRKFYDQGTMLQYACLQNYLLSGDSVTRAWCVQEGKWAGPNMTCTADATWCSRLENIENGWVEQATMTAVGGRATYNCQRGYHLAGRAERTCLAGGYWDGVPPSCEKVTCKRPPVVENAMHNGDPAQDMYPSGRQLMYACAHGFHGDGNPQVMCNGDGNWVGLTLTCSPVSCGFPGDVDRGHRTGFAFTFPNSVTYHCMEGFLIQGDSVRTCKENGIWSGILPACMPVVCPTLRAPLFGQMYGNSNEYGSVIRFQCNEKYRMVGSKERRCQADRTWSGETTKCEEIDCGTPSPFYNGYLIGHDTKVGGNLFFSCKIHATFQGSAFQTVCLETGEWSTPPPICWGQCQIPSIPNATLEGGRVDTWVNHNTTIQFRCRGGLVGRGGGTMRCDNGTWSETPECIPAPCESQPPHVHNGMRVFMGQEHGLKARYMCFAGYKLTGINGSYLTCNFGEWEGGRPHCEEFFCINPFNVTGDIAHGTINKKVHKGRLQFQKYIYSIRHGDRIEFQCNAGFRLAGHSGATCVDGEWRPKLGNGSSICVPGVHPPFRNLWRATDNLRN